jgi:ribosome biogenesis ATPase
LQEAVAIVQPSTKREGFSSIPNVKWEDVGALGSVQKMMEFFISRRIKHPEDYEVLWCQYLLLMPKSGIFLTS